MAYLQERMVHYLTSDPRLFVAEERLFQYGEDENRDVWYIDAFVVSPWERKFYLGEATYNLRPNPLLKKLHVFAERQHDLVKWLVPDGEPDKWVIRPWLFLRKQAVAHVLKNMPSGITPRISCLEMTGFPWEYEQFRKVWKEPPFPSDVTISASFRE